MRNAVFVEILKKYQHKYPNIHYVSASDILCDDTYCYGVKDGNLLYASRDHLSPYGSNYLINAISPDIDMALKIN